MAKTNEEIDAEATEKAIEKAKKAGDAAALEAKKVEADRIAALTFEEKIVELRKQGYQIGQGEAAGIADAASATLVTTGANLNVIHDGYKYNIDLDNLIRSEWTTKAEEIEEVLGVTFEDFEVLEVTSEQDGLEKLAVAAAKKAGGTFTPGKASAKATRTARSARTVGTDR